MTYRIEFWIQNCRVNIETYTAKEVIELIQELHPEVPLERATDASAKDRLRAEDGE